MEDMVASTPSKELSMHKKSHLKSKFKPKIRIVHVFAPEIIQTDAANFRELVQRLTGKPTAEINGKSKKTKKLPSTSLVHDDHANKTTPFEEKIKELEDNEIIWGDGRSTSSGNFFDGFKDFDGFIEELSESSHDMDVLDQVDHIHFSM